MSSVLDIIKRHHATFYRFDTNAPVRIRWRIAATIAASAALATLILQDMNDFLDGAITVQAILIGFSFSVMFFLVSSSEMRSKAQGESIEDGLKRERLSKLANEIFYNLSYFNIVALGCLVSSLILLLPDSASEFVRSIVSHTFPNRIHDELTSVILITSSFVMKFLLFFTLIESGYTFFRTTQRVSYLFGQRIP